MVCEVRGQRWRFLSCAVNAAKVVVRHEQGERMTMVCNGLRIAKCESRKPAIEDTSEQLSRSAWACIDFAAVWTTQASAAANASQEWRGISALN
jgi:hypothetical protein